MDLFANKEQNKFIDLSLKEAQVRYLPHLYSPEKATKLFNKLFKEVAWQLDTITVFGKSYPQPRLTALYSDNETPYSYSNITMFPKHYSPTLLQIKKDVEKKCGVIFTTALLNLYRDGNDSNGWHSDDEKELGNCPIIASVSLGEERMFHFKHKKDSTLKHKMRLQNGSLLLMKGETQHTWKHQIPKTKKQVGPRINLTFRIIKPL